MYKVLTKKCWDFSSTFSMQVLWISMFYTFFFFFLVLFFLSLLYFHTSPLPFDEPLLIHLFYFQKFSFFLERKFGRGGGFFFVTHVHGFPLPASHFPPHTRTPPTNTHIIFSHTPHFVCTRLKSTPIFIIISHFPVFFFFFLSPPSWLSPIQAFVPIRGAFVLSKSVTCRSLTPLLVVV